MQVDEKLYFRFETHYSYIIKDKHLKHANVQLFIGILHLNIGRKECSLQFHKLFNFSSSAKSRIIAQTYNCFHVFFKHFFV